MSPATLPSSLPFDIMPSISILPATQGASEAPLLQGQSDATVENLFGSELQAILSGVELDEAPVALENEPAELCATQTTAKPKRPAATILAASGKDVPIEVETLEPLIAMAKASTGPEVEVAKEAAADLAPAEKIVVNEQEFDEEEEDPVAVPELLALPISEDVVVAPTVKGSEVPLVDQSAMPTEALQKDSHAKPRAEQVAKPQAALPEAPKMQEARPVQTPRANREEHPRAARGKALDPIETDTPAPTLDAPPMKTSQNDAASAKGVEATENVPIDDRVTLRFRDVASHAIADERPAEAEAVEATQQPAAEPEEKDTAVAEAPESASDARVLDQPNAPIERSARPEQRTTNAVPRQESAATEKRATEAVEQRPQARVSATSTAVILDKQASGAVKTVSIRLPIEDGSRGGAVVQIDVARRNSVLEVRLAGSSDGLQKAVTESIDSLVQKLAVDRWSLDGKAPSLNQTPDAALPKLESVLPESVESLTRPTIRAHAQENAAVARELPLEASTQSAQSQQSHDGQRNQDFRQDSGSRENPQQQQQEEQKRPRREVWSQFLEAAEESFEMGLAETAPELQ